MLKPIARKGCDYTYGVTIQMKPLQQYFHIVLLVLYVVLTFESMDEILWCDHRIQQYFHGTWY